MIKSLNKLFVSLFLLIFAIGCAGEESYQEQLQDDIQEEQVNTPDFKKAVAVIHPTEGNDVSGVVTFEEVDEGVQVHAEVEGLSEGPHGFHIHKYGDCTAPDASSAGGHYNPNNNEHGAPTDSTRHMGDMGNIEANAQGNATLDYVDSHIKLNGSNSILGRGVIVHGGKDDLTSQPSGAAGPRLGCGVIGIANTGSSK